jgi:hypothetical protein
VKLDRSQEIPPTLFDLLTIRYPRMFSAGIHLPLFISLFATRGGFRLLRAQANRN